MKGFLYYLYTLGAIFVIFQFIPSYERTNPDFNKKDEINAPKKIMKILKNSCYDCHSYETKWPWYSNIAPMKWVIGRDVIQGRRALNFSIWNTYCAKKKEKLKKEISRSIYLAMPLPQYLWFHKKASLTFKERKYIQKWLEEASSL
jgi:hypothetical protein